MSKEHTPECGDVWQHKKLEVNVRIVYVNPLEVGYCHYKPCNNYLTKDYDSLKAFLKNFKYLGKSKVNLEELFDVE